jgi:hypothetical protein
MAVGRRNSGTQFHTAHTPFFLAPMERHRSQPRITENTMHLGRRHKSRKPIRIAQLPFNFSHPLIETRF